MFFGARRTRKLAPAGFWRKRNKGGAEGKERIETRKEEVKQGRKRRKKSGKKGKEIK